MGGTAGSPWRNGHPAEGPGVKAGRGREGNLRRGACLQPQETRLAPSTLCPHHMSPRTQARLQHGPHGARHASRDQAQWGAAPAAGAGLAVNPPGALRAICRCLTGSRRPGMPYEHPSCAAGSARPQVQPTPGDTPPPMQHFAQGERCTGLHPQAANTLPCRGAGRHWAASSGARMAWASDPECATALALRPGATSLKRAGPRYLRGGVSHRGCH